MSPYQRGDFVASESADKVVVHLVFNGQEFEMPDGTPFNFLQKGARVELKVYASLLNDGIAKSQLFKPDVRQLLSAGATVFARVDLRGIDDAIRSGSSRINSRHLEFAHHAKQMRANSEFIDQQTIQAYDGLVRLELEQPLLIKRIGQKAFQLDACRCTIWQLDRYPVTAHSLNHALTQISEFAEIDRVSHTGNAFFRCLVAVDSQLNPTPPWCSSKVVRIARQGAFNDDISLREHRVGSFEALVPRAEFWVFLRDHDQW